MRILSTYHNIQKATIIKTIDKKLRAKLDRDGSKCRLRKRMNKQMKYKIIGKNTINK